jgi:hypothetical protein
MGFNLAGAITGFVNESHKLHEEANKDATLKLKQGEAKDKHDLTQAHIYKLMSGGGKGGGAKPMSEYQRAMLPERLAKSKREAEKFEMQKAGTWNPSGRGGGIQIPSVESATDFGGTKPALPTTRTFTPAAPAVPTNSVNASSVPAPDDTEEPEEEEDDTDTDAEAQPTPKMYAGGMVSKPAVGSYAGGGAVQQFPPVQDNDASQTATPAPTPAVGGPAPQAAPAPTPAPAKPKGWNNSIGFDTTEVLDSWKKAPDPTEGKSGAIGESTPKKDPANVNPVRFGLAAMQEVYGTSKGASALDKGHSAIVEGVTKKPNAMTDQQYQQVAKVVDPHDELTEGARLIASLNAGVKNALSKGDVKSAKALAVGMVEMSAINSEKYGRYAMELIQKGDTKGAVHFLQKAYDTMPDGKELDAFVAPDGLVHARTRDSEGNVQDLGAFGGQQLMKVATGVANGSTYWQTMSRLAGMKPDKPKEAKPTPVPKLSDRTSAAKNIEDAASGFDLGKDLKPEDAKIVSDGVKSVAAQIHVSNDMDPAMSIRATKELISVDGKGAKLTPLQGGGASAVLADGSTLKLSNNALAQIASLRGRAQSIKDEHMAKTASEKETEAKKQQLIEEEKKKRQQINTGRATTTGAISSKAYIPELAGQR